MKKILTTLVIMLLCCLSVSAQEHIKFMGIPLDCTVSTFGQKLSLKGFKYSYTFEDGSRSYKGVFSGENCEVYVNNGANNIVKSVSVLIKKEFKSHAIITFEKFVSKYKQKYTITNDEGQDLQRMISIKAPGGNITMEMVTAGFYNIFIHYEDAINIKNSDTKELDDL